MSSSPTPLAVPAPAPARDPAFLRALDPAAVGALVQRHLLRAGELVALRPDYVRWKDRDGALLGYRAEVRDEDGLQSTYVTVRTAAPHRLADEAERMRHREDEDHAGLCALSLVPEANVLLLAFPIDRAMHDLRRLVRASKLRSLLLAACPAFVPEGLRFAKSKSRVRPVRYKPERRAVLHWQVGMVDATGAVQAQRSLWVRCHAEALVARSGLATAAAAAGGVRCPQPLAVVHDRLVLEEHVVGAPWQPRSDDAAGLAGAARTTARLHAVTPPPALPVHGPVQELDLALRAAEDLARLGPALGDAARTLADRLAAEVPAIDRLVFAHGDLHAGQFLAGGDGEHALCDFDRACQAPIAHDLACFRAHAVLAHGSAGHALADAFAAAYATVQALPARATSRWWNASALLRAASQPFRALRPDWPGATSLLLDHAAAALAGRGGAA